MELKRVSELLSKDSWSSSLKSVKPPTDWMNALVMNYLTTQGHARAAEQFHIETGTPMTLNPEGTRIRTNIRQSIENGRPDEAIDKVVDLNPELLEDNPALLFRLKKQEFIELVVQGKTEEALEFAEQELAGRVEDNEFLLKELETAMALLLFDNPREGPLSYLSGEEYRKETADQVNDAILSSETDQGTSRLPRLIHLLAWCQERCTHAPQVLTTRKHVPRIEIEPGAYVEYHNESNEDYDMEISVGDHDDGPRGSGDGGIVTAFDEVMADLDPRTRRRPST
ncbi:hypothetical protein M9435_005198 [Picochlorum sp. BPE23]|nr:hypothetical protein M9435_005198 [Picochlorum sp. BPE23]